MRNIWFLAIAALISGCATSTTIRSDDPGATLTLNEYEAVSIDGSFSRSYPTTTFGNYKFKATAEGADPMYGLVPLKFNGGFLALDILFFAPATFFNLRGVFPHYEFDIEEGVVRFKLKEEDAWSTYRPTQAEIANAKSYFGE